MTRPLIPFAVALSVSGMAFVGYATPGQQRAVASPAASRHLATGKSALSCPLPVGRQIKAVQAFREMMPVFRHPRCFNCHGQFDIRSEQHEGSEFAINSGLDPRALLTAPQRAALHESCGVCHSEVRGEMTRLDGTRLEGWLVAPAGDRALSLDDMRKYGVRKEPPPGTKQDLVAKARKWVELLDGNWKESPDCGCVLPKIKLRIHHRSAIDPTHVSHRAGQVGFSGDARFEVTLAAVHEAGGRVWYRGEKSLVRPLQTYFAAQGCRGTASQAEDWLLSAEVDTASAEMRLHWGFTTSDEKGESVCNRGGVVSRMELDPFIFGGESDQPVVMPLDSGATKEETTKEPSGSGQEWLVVKVIGVPEE